MGEESHVRIKKRKKVCEKKNASKNNAPKYQQCSSLCVEGYRQNLPYFILFLCTLSHTRWLWFLEDKGFARAWRSPGEAVWAGVLGDDPGLLQDLWS